MGAQHISREAKEFIYEQAEAGETLKEIIRLVAEAHPDEVLTDSCIGYHFAKARKALKDSEQVEEDESQSEESIDASNGFTVEEYWQKIVDAKDAHIASLETMLALALGKKSVSMDGIVS